jgi:hypothetical protein
LVVERAARRFSIAALIAALDCTACVAASPALAGRPALDAVDFATRCGGNSPTMRA